MITAMIASLWIARQVTPPLTYCPVLGEKANKKSPASEFAGSRFWFCCGGCDVEFKKSPEKYVKKSSDEKKVAGVFLFDPVSRQRLDIEKSKAWSDFQGIRYPFASEENRTKFEKDPKRFSSIPKHENLVCPVEKKEMSAPSQAAGYRDYEGVRYYLCCPGCQDVFEKDPGPLSASVTKSVRPNSVVVSPQDPPNAGSKADTPTDVKCTHCGKKMVIKDKADAETRCNVCGCGVAKKFCVPTGGS